MNVDPALLGTIFTGCITLAVAVGARRSTRRGDERTADLESRKVNLDEFREIRSSLNDRIDSLEIRLSQEAEARKAAERRATDADHRATIAEERSHRLERRVIRLEQVLREHHIEVPPESLD